MKCSLASQLPLQITRTYLLGKLGETVYSHLRMITLLG